MTAYDQIEHASMADIGIRRSHQQDAHAVLLASDEAQWQERGHIFVVADGMGGHAVGEMAAELAVNIIPHTYHKYAHEGPETALRNAVQEANASIHSRGQQNPEFEGMGTTATVLLLRPEGAWVAHVGDSRAYRIRSSRIEQLTFDHSWVWELARRQGVEPETLHHVPSNRILRSLGSEAFVQVDIEGPHPLQDGDVFVLCSDGLSGQVGNAEIGAIATALPAAEACQFLTHLANLRGGPDNITAVIVRVGQISNTESAKSAPRGHAWLQRLPWSYLWLALSLLLAVVAVVVSFSDRFLAFWLVVAAFVAILMGFIGLTRLPRSEPKSTPQRRRKPKVYKGVSCAVTQPMLAHLIKAATSLKAEVRQKNWETDWDTYRAHEQQAEVYRGQNDLPAAYREYCLAVRPLTDSFHRYHHREEVFQPLWERAAE